MLQLLVRLSSAAAETLVSSLSVFLFQVHHLLNNLVLFFIVSSFSRLNIENGFERVSKVRHELAIPKVDSFAVVVIRIWTMNYFIVLSRGILLSNLSWIFV